MINNLMEFSLNLMATAHEVLEKSNAIKEFSKIGRLELIGSLKLNLMFRRDIDLLVISEEIDKNNVIKITSHFLGNKIIKKISLVNYLNFPENEMPSGFYWEMIVIHNNEEWKLDIWYLKPNEAFTCLSLDAIKRFSQCLSNNPEKREIILKIKNAYYDGHKYIKNITGFDIYTAVLENDISDVSQFDVYMSSKI